MRYLIVQDWKSTHGNHAGMVHMCKLLCMKFPDKYSMIVKDIPKQNKSTNNLLFKLWIHLKKIATKRIKRRKFVKEYFELCEPLFNKLKIGDEVFLLEYHLPSVSQFEIAKYIKITYPYVRLYGLTHITPLWYKSHWGSKRMIRKWTAQLDKQLTLGSSLSNYMIDIGISDKKISTGFHYVDLDYYNNDIDDLQVNTPLTIIAMGALQRNFSLLAAIIKKCPEVNWIICKGEKNIDDLFCGLDNVKLVGYVEEDELRKYMSVSDLSLNVLEDTVGSNVITTSMAMGLGLIVSNVGSIHDYCDDSNAIFCDNTVESFSNEIQKLSQNKNKVLALKKSSITKSSFYNIRRVDEWFNTLGN